MVEMARFVKPILGMHAARPDCRSTARLKQLLACWRRFQRPPQDRYNQVS
jgi:hypothetical protein